MPPSLANADAAFHTARVAAHHALQWVAAAGLTHLPPDPTFESSNSGWSPDHGALLGRPLGADGVRVGLRLEDLELILVSSGQITGSVPLIGQTPEAASSRLRGLLAGIGLPDRALQPPEWDLPERPAGPFVAAAAGLHGLAGWYAVSHGLLTEVAVAWPGASEVRCWPHHFDIATLIGLDPPGPETARTVGVGMTPGDAGIAQPYLYVTPWPYPADRAVLTTSGPPLPQGRWHTEGWVGAVLDAGDLAPLPEADRAGAARTFLRAAVAAATTLAGNP